jgi:septal ring factor EnvC (AmiA/AmiB activator)
LQSEIRNAKLTREVRDELNTRLQDAFTMLHIRQDAVFTEKRQNAENQFQIFESRAKEILKQAKESTDYNKVRCDIKQIQAEIRESALFQEQRESLRNMIQEAFETVNNRQDQERLTFETEAQNNYNRLKKLVDDGLAQANESNEYKETREYLKKIQSEFRGIKLVKEQREVLYSRLQSAFDVLNTRVDIYFREKKKNWEVKMQYRLSSMNTEVYRLRETIAAETQNLKELEDFYQNIANPAVQDTKAVLGLKARMSSLQIGIEKKKQQVAELENEITDLQSRIETDKTGDNSLNDAKE